MITGEPTPGKWFIREFPGNPEKFFIAATPYEGHPYHGVTTIIEIMSDEDYPTKRADAEFIVEAVNAYRKLLESKGDRRSYPRLRGAFKNAEDATYKILRRLEETDANSLDKSHRSSG